MQTDLVCKPHNRWLINCKQSRCVYVMHKNCKQSRCVYVMHKKSVVCITKAWKWH